MSAVGARRRATWTAPPLWGAPRDWVGESTLVICGGESVRAQREQIRAFKGRVIAVKHGVLLRPDADVLFFAGERAEEIAPPCLAAFRGTDIVVRGKGHPVFPDHAKRIWRTTVHVGLSDDPFMVSGYDAGTSAINLATLRGSKLVVVVGYDMTGGRWFNGEIPHYLPQPPERDFQIHMSCLPAIAEDAKRKGIRIVNCSPTSRVDCFEREPLEAFL